MYGIFIDQKLNASDTCTKWNLNVNLNILKVGVERINSAKF